MAKRMATLKKENRDRARAAFRTIDYFAHDYGEIPVEMGGELLKQNLVDLLTNIAHLCDQANLNLPTILESVRNHYRAETSGVGKQFPD